MSNSNINNSLKSLESLYLKGDYDSAIEMQKNMGKEFSPGHLYYNLGTLNFKKGDLAAGRYYLELAKKYGFNSSLVEHNLSVAKRKLEVSEISLEDTFFNKAANFILETPTSHFLTLTLLLITFSIFLYRSRFIKNTIVFILVLIFSILPIGFHKFYLSKIKLAVSLGVSEIYEGPSTIFSKIGSIRPGEKIIIGEESNDWLYIAFPKNLNGWVSKNQLGIL